MAGLEPIGGQLPYPVHGIDSDNGSVFINETLTEYCGYRSSERLTGALLDRLTHHVHILEMNGESYRLKGSRQSAAALASASDRQAAD